MHPGRNDPCHCGSGKKYKKCHMVTDEGNDPATSFPGPTSSRNRGRRSAPIPPEVREALQQSVKAERHRKASFGDVRPIIHADFQGHKFVAVGGTLHWSKNWRTFIDFLFDYLPKVLGPAWGKGEIAKPLPERHIVLQWFAQVGQFRARHRPGPDGLSHGTPDGPTRAYLALAYDLYIVADNLRLQERLVGRLKNKDQFQGARYELAVAATLIRAGFQLELEDEGDVSRKHVEFRATHRRSKEVVAIEAKSRHRSGVLGREGVPTSQIDFRVGITNLLRKAVAKRPGIPYFIFIDANMPPSVAIGDWQTWVREVSESIIKVGHGFASVGVFEGGPFNAMILTNLPDHYGEPGGAIPPGVGFISEAFNPMIPLRDRSVLADIERSVKQYGVIPSGFPSNA
jgi:hypothetical protein